MGENKTNPNQAAVPEKKIEKVISGTAKTKQKSGVSKVTNALFAEDLKSVIPFVIDEYVILIRHAQRAYRVHATFVVRDHVTQEEHGLVVVPGYVDGLGEEQPKVTAVGVQVHAVAGHVPPMQVVL